MRRAALRRARWDVVLAALGIALLFVSASGSSPHGVAETIGVAGLLLVVPALVRGWRHLRGRGGPPNGGFWWGGGPPGGGGGGHHHGGGGHGGGHG